MKDIKVSDTHNYAIVGHAHDGKTSVGEAILHAVGATPALGSVAAGTTVLNPLPEEKERKTTMTSSVFSYDAGGKHFSLVDTPGDSNFAGDAQIVLQRLDGAVLVVSAVDGARVGTDRSYRFCRDHGVLMVAFVNGLDRERASFDAALESLTALGAKPVTLTLPIGEHEGFSGVVDLWTGRAHTAAGAGDPPAELADEIAAAREKLVEDAAECDDAILEKYLEEGELSEEDLRQALVSGTRAAKILPVLCGSATRELGLPPLLHAIADLLPSAADRAAP